MTQIPMPYDLELVETLTGRVRMLALPQIRSLCHASEGKGQNIQRRLQRLAARGLLEVHEIYAHLLNPSKPLFVWRPGRPAPEPHNVSRVAQARWRFAAVPITVCVASQLAANLFGSTAGGMPRREHYDHDLLLATAYLHYRARRMKTATEWVGEHVLAKAGYRIKDPDAFLRDRNGKLRCAIESAGRYSPHQVESFHEHCAEHDLPYELW